MDTLLKNLIGIECFIYLENLIIFPALMKNMFQYPFPKCVRDVRALIGLEISTGAWSEILP
jgi:hypothetical protein